MVPNPDTITQFRIQTSQYDSGYGAHVPTTNLITKSGANAIHGARGTPLSQRPVLDNADWPRFAARLTRLAEATAAEGLVLAYHHVCVRLLRRFEARANTRGHVWFRWFNEAPVLILRHRERSVVPGGAGNAIYNLADLGVTVLPVGVIGDDELDGEAGSAGALGTTIWQPFAPAVQPLLPQVFVSNQHVLSAVDVAQLNSACPSNVFFVRRKSSWVNVAVIFSSLLRSFKIFCTGSLATSQTVRFSSRVVFCGR